MLVVDFGAQYAQLIARRVREARVFSEVIPHTASVDEIKARNPRAVVLSGGPASVYAEGAPQLDPALFDLDVPVFGICYGFQAMAQALGGTVAHTGTSEYGRTELKVTGGQLHSDLPDTQPVWMSHGDAVTEAPEGFDVVATSAGAPVAAFEDRDTSTRRGAVPPRGDAHPARPAGAEPVPARVRGHRRRRGPRPTSPTPSSSRCARRSVTGGRSAGCPVVSTPRWPPPWCSVPSATG